MSGMGGIGSITGLQTANNLLGGPLGGLLGSGAQAAQVGSAGLADPSSNGLVVRSQQAFVNSPDWATTIDINYTTTTTGITGWTCPTCGMFVLVGAVHYHTPQMLPYVPYLQPLVAPIPMEAAPVKPPRATPPPKPNKLGRQIDLEEE